MVLGNAGLVAMIATFANSMRPAWALVSTRFGWLWAGFGPLVNLVIIAGGVYLTWRFFTRSQNTGDGRRNGISSAPSAFDTRPQMAPVLRAR